MSALSQSKRAAKAAPAETYCYDSASESEIDETTPEFLRLYEVFLRWAQTKALRRPSNYDQGESVAREFRRHVWATDTKLFESVEAHDPTVFTTVLYKWDDEPEAAK